MKSPFKLWQKTFPDPSNSPAHYTRSLSILTSPVAGFVEMGVGDWIRTFSGVVRLEVRTISSNENISFVPLRGLSPILKSLHLVAGTSALSSDVLGLVCSFPSLEDLTLDFIENDEVDEWDIPLTSPKLTGCLDLNLDGGIRSAVRRLLELPGGLHFSKISVSCFEEDVEPMTDLVSKCSDTLESLSISYLLAGAGFLPVFMVDQYLTATFLRSQAQHTFA